MTEAESAAVFPRPGFQDSRNYARGFAEGEELGLTDDDPGDLGLEPPYTPWELGLVDGCVQAVHARGACFLPNEPEVYDDIFHNEDGSHRVTPVTAWVTGIAPPTIEPERGYRARRPRKT
jgi:hypothetical protein